MAVNIGSMVAKIGADTSGLKRGMREARRVTKQGSKDISRNIGGITKSFGLLKAAMLAAVGGYAGKRLATSFLEVAESFEAMEVKLNALTKGRGKEVLEEINAWAIKMPVNTQQAVQAFTTMRAMGLDPTIKSMQTLVDVGAVMGDDALPRISLALGQMRSLEKISAQDLNQLAQVGINARRYIKEAFGVGYEEVQKMGVNITDVIDVIMKKMEEEFGGSAAMMMESWRGLKLTFVSYLVEMQRAVMDAGVFDELKTQLSNINDAMWEWWKSNEAVIKQKVPEYMEAIKDGTKGAYDSVKSLYEFYDSIPSEIVGAAGYGILGRMIFGSWPAARLAAAVYGINELVKGIDPSLGLGTLKDDAYEAYEALKKNYEILTGKRSGETNRLFTDLELDRKELADINKELEKYKSIVDWTKGSKFNFFNTKDEEKYQELLKKRAELMKKISEGDKTDFTAWNKEVLKDAEKTAKALKKLNLTTRAEFRDVDAAETKMIAEAEKRRLAAIEAEKKAYLDMLPIIRTYRDSWEVKGERTATDEQLEKLAMLKTELESLDTKKINDELSDFFKDIDIAEINIPVKIDTELTDFFNEVDEAEAKLNDKFEMFKTISEETARAMQASFSDYFFDVYKGELDSLSDYVNGFLDSIAKAITAHMGQMMATSLFGDMGSAGGGGGGFFSWLTGAITGGSSKSATRVPGSSELDPYFSFAGGGHLGEGVRGVGLSSGKSYEFHAGEDVIDSSKRSNSNIQIEVKVENHLNKEADVQSSTDWVSPNKAVANIVLSERITSRSFRQGLE